MGEGPGVRGVSGVDGGRLREWGRGRGLREYQELMGEGKEGIKGMAELECQERQGVETVF